MEEVFLPEWVEDGGRVFVLTNNSGWFWLQSCFLAGSWRLCCEEAVCGPRGLFVNKTCFPKKSLSKGFFFGKLDFDFHTLCNFLQVWSLVEIVEGI